MSNYNAIKQMFEKEIYYPCPAIEELLNLSPDLWSEVENLEDEDGDLKEIFSWYRITELLYKDLKEKEEPVLEFRGAYYWGRRTFGQSIYADGIFEELYEERIEKYPFLA